MNLIVIPLLASVLAAGIPASPAASETSDSGIAARIAEIDAIFEADWHARNVVPAEPTSDAEFLRRVTLDLTGVIPDIGEARAFLADQRADKRARWIEQLLR